MNWKISNLRNENNNFSNYLSFHLAFRLFIVNLQLHVNLNDVHFYSIRLSCSSSNSTFPNASRVCYTVLYMMKNFPHFISLRRLLMAIFTQIINAKAPGPVVWKVIIHEKENKFRVLFCNCQSDQSFTEGEIPNNFEILRQETLRVFDWDGVGWQSYSSVGSVPLMRIESIAVRLLEVATVLCGCCWWYCCDTEETQRLVRTAAGRWINHQWLYDEPEPAAGTGKKHVKRWNLHVVGTVRWHGKFCSCALRHVQTAIGSL